MFLWQTLQRCCKTVGFCLFLQLLVLFSVSKCGIFDAFREFLPLVLREFHLSIPSYGWSWMNLQLWGCPQLTPRSWVENRSKRAQDELFFSQQSKAFGAALGCVLALLGGFWGVGRLQEGSSLREVPAKNNDTQGFGETVPGGSRPKSKFWRRLREGFRQGPVKGFEAGSG